jgi:hypothetical protein
MPSALGRLLVASVFSIVLFGGAASAPQDTSAASCVRISGGRFDAPGNDNYAAYLNGEFVRVHNYCSTAKYLTGYRIHDYGRLHTYYFRAGTRIGAYGTITLYSGRGTNTVSRVYWGRSYGAVWNNTPPERAYLRNSVGTLVSSWSSY